MILKLNYFILEKLYNLNNYNLKIKILQIILKLKIKLKLKNLDLFYISKKS